MDPAKGYVKYTKEQFKEWITNKIKNKEDDN